MCWIAMFKRTHKVQKRDFMIDACRSSAFYNANFAAKWVTRPPLAWCVTDVRFTNWLFNHTTCESLHLVEAVHSRYRHGKNATHAHAVPVGHKAVPRWFNLKYRRAQNVDRSSRQSGVWEALVSIYGKNNEGHALAVTNRPRIVRRLAKECFESFRRFGSVKTLLFTQERQKCFGLHGRGGRMETMALLR